MNLVGSSVSFEHEVPGADILCFFHGLIASDLCLQKEHFRACGVLQTKRDACLVIAWGTCDKRSEVWSEVLPEHRLKCQCFDSPDVEMWTPLQEYGGDTSNVEYLENSWWWRRWWWWLLKRNSTWIFPSKDSSLQLPGSNARVRENRMNSGVFIARKQVTWTWGLKPWPGFQVNEVDRWVGE